MSRSKLAACVVAFLAPCLAGGQALLEFRDDLAFRAEAVEAFAERAYRQRLSRLDGDRRLDRDAALLGRLEAVLGPLRVAAAAEHPDAWRIRWEVHACRSCGETASAMAGGRLLFGEEFLEGLALDDDELGFLVAHEMAHVLAQHTREFATAARYFVDNGLRREYWDIQRELDASLSAQYRMAFVAEQQELEADRIAMLLGAMAGFDTAAMSRLLAKLEQPRSLGPSTHPGSQRRLLQAETMRQTAEIIRARALLGLDR